MRLLRDRPPTAGLADARCSDNAAAAAGAPPGDGMGGMSDGNGRTFAFGDQTWPGLAKFVEEAGEALAVIGKLMMTHGHPRHWSGDLRQMLLSEVGDVEASIVFLVRHNLTAFERRDMANHITRKVFNFEQWHEEQALKPAEEHVP